MSATSSSNKTWRDCLRSWFRDAFERAMIWSISNGTRDPACGKRQYSHRPAARFRTNLSNAASMPMGRLLMWIKREARLGVHQIDEVTDAKIVFKLGFF